MTLKITYILQVFSNGVFSRHTVVQQLNKISTDSVLLWCSAVGELFVMLAIILSLL